MSKTRKPLNVIHGNDRFTKFNKDRGDPGGAGFNTQTGNNININPAGVVSGTGAGFPTGNTISPQGGFIGGEAGYNWQNGAFVYGIEFGSSVVAHPAGEHGERALLRTDC